MHVFALIFLAWVIWSLCRGRYRSRPPETYRPQEVIITIRIEDQRRDPPALGPVPWLAPELERIRRAVKAR